MNFSTSWVFRGWITCALLIFYAQNTHSRSLQCDEAYYFRGNNRCCNKCEPGSRVFSVCNDSKQTTCVKCPPGEYQHHWTQEKHCLRQKFCDPGKGFLSRPENLVAEEPCRCRPNFQCSPINCEYCERIPTCGAGYGLEPEADSTNDRKICVACKRGFFSADSDDKQCKQWTNCKAEGRGETRPGSARADAVCGPPVSAGTAPSWVIVSVLAVISALRFFIMLLFCCKNKLKLLSVNLRSCVQNLKRTRIQQETLAPLYHSGAAGGPGSPKCAPCETSKLVCQAPHNVDDDPPGTCPTSTPDVKVSLPLTRNHLTEKVALKRATAGGEQTDLCSGGPEEVSEEEVGSVPLLAGSCVCGAPVHEPLEVGENEDCSQAVSPGRPATCSCREERGNEDSERADKDQEKMSKSETSVASLVSVSPLLLHTSRGIPQSSPPPELCLPLSQSQTRPETKTCFRDGSGEELHRLASSDSASTQDGGPMAASVMTSASPSLTSSSVGELYLEKAPGASSQEQSQELSWGDSKGNKLLSGELDIECPPKSLQSQLAEPTLTSGQVSGNHNTTFISSGQVMNFSGDVIVVYVSQTSLGSDGAGLEDDFGSPVQEQANETAPFFQSGLRSPGDSVTQCTLQDETLPVQEVIEPLSHEKRKLLPNHQLGFT